MQQPSHNMRTFYTLILTQVFSLIGSRISGLAIGIYVFNQTGDATPLALVSFFAILPQVIASGVSGVLADRYDRRYVMALSDAGQAVGTVLLLFSFLSGNFQLWHLYGVAFIQAIFGVFQGPAFMSSVTMLVPDSQRDRANAIQQLSGPTAGIIAPAIAGLIYSAVGVTGAIGIDLLTFLVAVVVVLRVHIPHPEKTAEGAAFSGSVWKESLGGFRYLLARRPLFILMLHISLLNFLVGGSAALMTPYVLARTGSEATLGILLSLMNLGAITGGVLLGVLSGKVRTRIHLILPGVLVMGAFLVTLGMSQGAVLIGASLFLVLLPTSIINATFMSLLQAKVAPDIQGRVFAVIGQLAMLLMPLAYLLVGPLADNMFEPAVAQPGWGTIAPLVGNSAGAGMGLIMVIGGVLIVLTTLVVYAIPTVRHLERNIPDYVPMTTNSPETENMSGTPAEAAAVVYDR
ncbi:MAG: MFS transporter [Anaerolineaceae bacterium]|nr:MFS transporter [Anaerolineaceae bacterium]